MDTRRRTAGGPTRTEWTGAGAPGGRRRHSGGDPTAPLRAAAEAIGVDLDALSAEEREQLAAELEQMMAARREIANTPASEMISNHLIRFLDLATIYLESEPPAFADAATAIEAFRAVLEGVGDRLGESQPMLTEALGQVQMIFVQVKQAHEGGAPAD